MLGAKALVPPPMHSFWLGWEGAVPTYGLSDREMAKTDQTIEIVLPVAQKALARGDIGFLKWEIDELLKLSRISLDPKCSSYRELGQAVLNRLSASRMIQFAGRLGVAPAYFVEGFGGGSKANGDASKTARAIEFGRRQQ